MQGARTCELVFRHAKEKVSDGFVQALSQALSPRQLDDTTLSFHTWTTAAKEGVGTAYCDDAQGLQSLVWFTLARGVLTEVYYPDIACPSLRLLQLSVTDATSFFDCESTDAEHVLTMPETDALLYRQSNRAHSKRYTVHKTYCTDPDQHALVVDVTVQVHEGSIGDYQFTWLLYPSVGGAMANNRGVISDSPLGALGCVYTDAQALAAGASVPLQICQVAEKDLPTSFAEWSTLWAEPPTAARTASDVHVQMLRLQLPMGAQSEQSASFRLVVGFGERPEKAQAAAMATLGKPFAHIRERYCEDWRAFVRRLHPPAVEIGVSETQYKVAAMIVKAHEDKRHLGAVAASLSIPWGDSIAAHDPGTGGYHLIWSRDLYQIASGLASVGDDTLARRALRYLQDVQQRADGSFPQNTWPDGSPYWLGVQLDQTAFPILLAYLVDAGMEYERLITRAADFLVHHGPHSQQERWEENSGYSPSTLAAVIASLVAAGMLAKKRGAFGAAAAYLATADEWAERVQDWTVVKMGPLSVHPYYLRVSDTMNPDDGHFIEIKNGGGWHPKATIVDAGFLELVRLGIQAADDAVIAHSLDVIDQQILWESEQGHPYWYRYNQDGYGEAADGTPYHGVGKGHPWPLLSGERGEYEVALAASAKRHVPARAFGPAALLAAMAHSANSGLLIAEQVWDGASDDARHLAPGEGTGAATPLAWAMAQYLRLAECVRQGRVVETPADVQARYVLDPPGAGPLVRLDLPESMVTLAVAQARIVLSGQTAAHVTVACLTHGQYFYTESDATGRFACSLQLGLAGDNLVQIIGYDHERSVSRQTITIAYRPHRIYSAKNYNASANGRVKYQYPTHPDFKPGDFLLSGTTIYADQQNVYFEIELGHLDNPWGGPTGISKQIIDIYLAKPDEQSPGQLWTKDLGAHFRADAGWHKLIRVSGNWHGDAHVYNSDWTFAGPIRLAPNYQARTVGVAVPQAVLGGCPSSGWGVMVVVAGEAGGRARPVRAQATEWTFGGAEDDRHSYILDYLVTPELMADTSAFVSDEELPMNRLP